MAEVEDLPETESDENTSCHGGEPFDAVESGLVGVAHARLSTFEVREFIDHLLDHTFESPHLHFEA